MAPEQIAGAPILDGRADVYAVGVILYRALSGRQAFPGEGLGVTGPILAGNAEPLRLVNPDIPQALANVVARAMAVRPELRYESMSALSEAFTDAVFEETHRRPYEVSKSGRPRFSNPTKPERKAARVGNSPAPRLVMALGGALVLAIAAIVALVVAGTSASNDGAPQPAAHVGAEPSPSNASVTKTSETGATQQLQEPPSRASTDTEGSIRLESEPSGARVLHEGEDMGRTPITVSHARLEPPILTVQQAGFVTRTINLSEETPKVLIITLARAATHSRPSRSRSEGMVTGRDRLSTEKVVNPWVE
jgi:serine/threonine protein kinase